MKSILNIEPKNFSAQAAKILSKIGKVNNGPFSRENLLKKIHLYDIIIVRLAHKIDKELIDAATRLKVISSATTGLNHIDFNYAQKKGIKVLSLKDETRFLKNIYATAEHTWALLLSLIRKIPYAHNSVINGKWDRDRFKGRELNGSTIGIVGLGRIGLKIADYAISFGMNVLSYTKGKNNTVKGVTIVNSLEELIENSDIITIHVPFNSSTRKMFGKSEFNRIKKGALLINTSRGEILDEAELIKAIKNGNLAGAALDVISKETSMNDLNKSKIIQFNNKDERIIITPHIGGATYESMEKTEVFMANKILKHLLT